MTLQINKKKHTFIILLIIGITSSCSSNVKLQTQIDEVNSIHYDKTYPNTGDTLWAVGQWSLYKTHTTSREEIFRLFSSDSINGFRKVSITGKSGTSFWLEQHIVLPDHEQHIAALVAGRNYPDKTHLTISKLKFTQPGGEIVEIDEENLASDTAQDAMEEMQFLINLLEHSHRKGRSRNITVPAGTFNNVNVVPISMSLLLGQVTGNVLYSQAVPILSIASLQTTHDTSGWFKDSATWELAGFGQTGSSSYFSFQKE